MSVTSRKLCWSSSDWLVLAGLAAEWGWEASLGGWCPWACESRAAPQDSLFLTALLSAGWSTREGQPSKDKGLSVDKDQQLDQMVGLGSRYSANLIIILKHSSISQCSSCFSLMKLDVRKKSNDFGARRPKSLPQVYNLLIELRQALSTLSLNFLSLKWGSNNNT